ncbi:PEP-utilizing enzyme [Actinoplanes sp. G11-F43]|uniref:PEP-utilizing enzyme n=1 Tax=Actinoplanes sp. G11-F43 TaxID=3424130 RepID=UPI003D34D706
MLFGSQGGDVVSGRFPTRPLAELADREPAVWAALLAALSRLERHYRDVCHVEFTYESGRLWFLQVRPGGLSGRAAVRAAVDLADEGITDRETALTRVTPWQLRAARIPRIRLDGDITIVGRGIGASPGAADGRIAVTADQAARMATTGPVILVRPHTSPLDVHGMAAAAGIVTTVGGPTSHAAVVARSLGRPAVVGATSLRVDTATGCVDSPAGPLAEGTWITIDGTGGEIVLGRPEIMSGEADPHLARLLSWAAASLA